MTRKPHVLVVDDELDTRTYLFSILESEGYSVGTASDGMEALKYVSKNKPDAVVSDVRMPEIEGLELLSKIRFVSPQTHVILITAYADAATVLEVIEKGGDDLLLKPFRNEELLASLRRSLA